MLSPQVGNLGGVEDEPFQSPRESRGGEDTTPLGPGESGAGATHSLVFHEVWKVLIFLVLVLALLPHAASGFQKSSSSQNGPFLQCPSILAQGRRPLALPRAVCELEEGGGGCSGQGRLGRKASHLHPSPPEFLVTAFTLWPFTCRGVRVPGELSSCRMVRGDLPSTLPLAFRLLCLEPRVGKELKPTAQIKGLQFTP